jgi:mono/diheme cytochrome c family protein
MQVSGLLLGGWSSRRGSISVATGTAIVFLGLFLGLNASGLMLQETFIGDNPYPSDTKSLETGQRFYLQFCEVCHGISGRGDGPLASSLDPPPADLIVHVPLHPDYILFRFAQEGIPGTSMVPLGEKLANEEIWHLVNYIQTLK